MKPIFNRSSQNPIVTALSLPFSAEAVLNPGAAEVDGTVVLLLRVESMGGFSSIHVARSRNGVTDWEIEPKPFLEYGQPRWRYERWGCEDARVTWIAEQKMWYITYTAYSSAGAAVSLARTKDFTRAERLGLIFSPNNKDATLFPQRFRNRWAVLHRPGAGGIENIWSAYSPDLVHWGEPHCVLTEGFGPAWDAVKVGAGPPPVLTRHGWLLLYHGVKAYAGQLAYRLGAAMLDRDRPHKLIARSPNCIFKATALYETTGLVPNVVFPTGLLLRGDELWMYYGAADTCVCLATVKLQDVLDTLEEHTKPFTPPPDETD
ncbi:MAG TPA: glycosidase [Planctomycetota bacterium]|nr:glycosidase [Planctomycetota bacterium]